MPSSQQYSVVPRDDFPDDLEDNPVKAPKSIFASILICISLLSFGILYLTLGAASLEPAIKSDDEYATAFRDHLARAGGDEYLLGVGKADITGGDRSSTVIPSFA
ncbi:hypothetical protein M7I_1832 [Glarea lozoyensis 74030]|uniref:Uncharacterized protein n=1 Tax=Glarea lozoyensis (strain ATCC 74030 / MF5533) TaxID=1104152 RepID=H0EGX4_GLAL7|nr:hypothetical protein M7I_1832 [Glarea lozoyensis 74030]